MLGKACSKVLDKRETSTKFEMQKTKHLQHIGAVNLSPLRIQQAIPVAVRSMAEHCNSLIAGITGLNPAVGMGVRLFCCVLCR